MDCVAMWPYPVPLVFAMDEEIWRVVPGYTGYEVSNLGRVRGPQGIVVPYRRQISCRVEGGPQQRVRVGRLVLDAFQAADKPTSIKPRTRYLDGNPDNCKLDNLVWVQPAKPKVRKPPPKLAGPTKAELIQLIEQGLTYTEIGAQFDVACNRISYLRVKYGLPSRRSRSSTRRPSRQQLVQWLAEGRRVSEITKQLGYSSTVTVYDWLKDYGISTPERDRSGKTYKSKEQKRKRHSRVGQDWRAAVSRRDGGVCVLCGSTKKLQAHHLQSWARYPAFRYVLSNGVTLCEVCHKAIHAKYGRFATPMDFSDALAEAGVSYYIKSDADIVPEIGSLFSYGDVDQDEVDRITELIDRYLGDC